MSTKPDALLNLADALAEDVINTPADELLREVEEDYGDPHALAIKFDQILERAEKQVFTARSAASPQVRSSVLDLPYRLLEWFSTLFGRGPGRSGTQFQLFSVNRMVWAGAAGVLIVFILAAAVFRSMSEFDERSRQLAAQEKEQLARSEQLAAQEKELLARWDRLAAQEKGQAVGFEPPSEIRGADRPSILCKISITEPGLMPRATGGIDRPRLDCTDADLAFWQNLVSAIYEHRWRQLDTNGQQRLHQAQLDWLKNMRANCKAAFEVPVSETAMARAKSCVLQSTKKRVAVLSNN